MYSHVLCFSKGICQHPADESDPSLQRIYPPCQQRKIFPLYNQLFIYLFCMHVQISYRLFFSFSHIFLLLPSLICTAVMLSNSSFSVCTGGSSINQGVADTFRAVLRVSLSLGDIFKLLLSNSGFMFLLPSSVFKEDNGV